MQSALDVGAMETERNAKIEGLPRDGNNMKKEDGRIRAAARQRSALLNLPAELRNKIYELCLVYEDTISILWVARNTNERKQFQLKCHPHEPALVRTSRQLRYEGSPIYYAANSFHVRLRKSLYRWLTDIGERNRAMLNDVRGFCYDQKIAFSNPAESMLLLKDIEKELKEVDISLPKDTFRKATIVEGKEALLNQTELAARMTEQDWSRYSDIAKHGGGQWLLALPYYDR